MATSLKYKLCADYYMHHFIYLTNEELEEQYQEAQTNINLFNKTVIIQCINDIKKQRSDLEKKKDIEISDHKSYDTQQEKNTKDTTTDTDIMFNQYYPEDAITSSFD